MTEVNTDSYPKPAALPVQKSALDQAQQFQQLESGKLGIDQQKLNQANQALGYMTRALGSLGPDATKEQYLAVGQNAVKMGLVPAKMLNTYVERLQAAPTAKDFYNEFTTAAATHQETIDYHLGRPGTTSNGQKEIPVMTSPKFGIKRLDTGAVNQPVQQQLPPGTQVVDPTNPSAPTRALGAQPEVPAPQAQPQLPIKQNAIPGPSANFGGTVTGAEVAPTLPVAGFNNRFAGGPTGPATAQGPGISEAEAQAGSAAGTQLANAREKSANFQREIYPLAQAIPALEKLGTKGTGPGTETINNIKSFILSNVPGISEKDTNFKNIKTYDEARKYLTDVVNQIGNTGTNDKLAAAFAGNPSVHISNAAATDVAKSLLALRRSQQAVHLEFENSNLPASQYSKWIAKRNNEIDPRAFGVDVMSPEAKKKLLVQLNKNPIEKARFDKSLELAVQSKFLTPPKAE